jgi:hypothetical protein
MDSLVGFVVLELTLLHTGGKKMDSPNFAMWECLSYKSTPKTCID